MEMELRKSEAREDEWKQRALLAEQREEALAGQVAEFERIAGSGVNELRMKLDSMQGRVVTADALIIAVKENFPELYAEVIG